MKIFRKRNLSMYHFNSTENYHDTETNTEVGSKQETENDKFDENVDTTDVDKILSIDPIFDQNEDIPEEI